MAHNVPTYARVKYHGVYPGVDLVFYGNQQQTRARLRGFSGGRRQSNWRSDWKAQRKCLSTPQATW